MDLSDVVLLLAAGGAAGVVNALAGGGSLITFPALIATGLPPVAANVTNALAVFPGYAASVAGSRADLSGQRHRVRAVLPACVLGAVAGCALLLLTPARAFELVAPVLVLAATAVLAFRDRLRTVVGHPRAASPRRRTVVLQLVVFTGSVYGGYFGAALGVMFVAALGLVLDEGLARVNALKNVLSVAAGLVAVAAFALFGPVDAAAVAVLAPATLAGGYAGARLARRLPARVLGYLIVTFGAVVGALLLYRAVVRDA